MDEYFNIPVTYQGEELSFTSKLLMTGYIHKFQVKIGEEIIFFEPDEDGNYRAIIDQEQINNDTAYDEGLLKAIANVIESMKE